MLKPELSKQLTFSDIILILVNLWPVWGVWFNGWQASEVFLVYCMESVIVGLFNIIKMLTTTLVKKRDVWENNGVKSMQSGFLFIFFFIVHYGLFVFVQVSMFLAVSNFKNGDFKPSGFFNLLFHFPQYMPQYALWLLFGFTVSYGFQVIKDFILSGTYRTADMGKLMFSPYARIFIQQFAVILGSMFLLFGAGKIFILIFALIKIFFEVYMNFEKALNEAVDKPWQKIN